MDLGPDPADRDDIIQRYGRRLFVLAYHLTGDAPEAAELSHESLVRGLLAPDFPSSEKDAVVFLHRGLISLWRERMGQPGRGGALRVAGGTASAGAARAPREHAGLWRALSRLDPVSRAVLVLRVAEGLEYETIGKVLDMAPDIVYARLLQARGGLQDGERSIDHSLFETMNLFLDGRLPGDQRGDFEARLRTDAALRDRVEFHRGLTLELHEEAPALPRDYVSRLRERLDRAQETLALVDQAAQMAGWEPTAQTARPATPAPDAHRPPRWAAVLAGAVVVLIIGVALGSWAARRRPPEPGPGSVGAGTSAKPGATPDEATIEALRSLGYLAPAKEHAKRAPGKPGRTPAGASATPATTPKPAKNPVPGAPKPVAAPKKTPAPAASPAPSASPVPSAAPAPPAPAPSAPPAPERAATPAEPPADAPRQERIVAWRAIAVGRGPETGRDFQVIRTAQEWTALLGGPDAPPPIDFAGEMVVLLRPGLAVAAVQSSAEALLIECRREQPGPETAPAGQAVVMPISDLPIRLVVR
jgi:DNA-directed RNA polymerase specialized sigma24 family protein